MYGRNRYRQEKVTTAQPGDLVVMLYDGILRFVGEAHQALGASDPAGVGKAVRRCLDIIGYLQASLREDAAPELVQLLDRTYNAWCAALVRAHASRDAAVLDAIRAQVADLRDAWAEANSQRESESRDAGAHHAAIRTAA